ncbi:MAG: tetratricopeptide repeat protein [Deltaproteobacteria bacterium]|nr:tetratricopeptide repeat protein [Deltaproteobacteria bacterium]
MELELTRALLEEGRAAPDGDLAPDELTPRQRAARRDALAESASAPHAVTLSRLVALLRERPSSPRLHLEVGCLAALAGAPGLARAHLSRALELAPGGWAAVAYAELLVSGGRRAAGGGAAEAAEAAAEAAAAEAAEALVGRALRRDPAHPALLLLRARLAHRGAGAAAALDAYGAAAEAARGGGGAAEARALFWYALAAHEAGERRLTRTLAEVACERHPGHEALWYLCGEVRAAAGESGGARRALERALALNPRHLPARRALGRLLLTRHPRAAARHLRLAAPFDAEVRLDLARLAARQGRPAEARAALEALLAAPGAPPAALSPEAREEARALLRALSAARPLGLWARLRGAR